MDPKKAQVLYTIKWTQGKTPPRYEDLLTTLLEAAIMDMPEYKEAKTELARIMAL